MLQFIVVESCCYFSSANSLKAIPPDHRLVFYVSDEELLHVVNALFPTEKIGFLLDPEGVDVIVLEQLKQDRYRRVSK